MTGFRVTLEIQIALAHIRKTFGDDIFERPERLYAALCDLLPTQKPFAAATRRLAEQGVLSALRVAAREGDLPNQTEILKKACIFLTKELSFSESDAACLLLTLESVCGSAPPESSDDAARLTPFTPVAAVGVAEPLKWVLYETGLLTLSGQGDMGRFPEGSPWVPYRDAIRAVVIQNGVHSIAKNAFSLCGNLTETRIASSVSVIGDAAFSDCGSLLQVAIPQGVSKLGFSVFRNCRNLRKAEIPNSVRRIENKAFAGCVRLKSVRVPYGTWIHPCAFSAMTNLSWDGGYHAGISL